MVEYAAGLRLSGRDEEAEKILQTIIAENKCPVDAFVELSKLFHEHRGEVGQATKIISTGLVCAPRDLRLLELFGRISRELGYTRGIETASQMIRAVDDQHPFVVQADSVKKAQDADKASRAQAWDEYYADIEAAKRHW